MADFNISLDVENIGPHTGDKQIHFSETVNSNKLAIYAPNGTGKSFISRAFRLASPDASLGVADKVLSMGKDNGALKFGINGTKTLEISISRGTHPIVNNNTGLIFYTFNSDYVDENIRANNYNPDGNITGYILGRVQIDLTEDRRREQSLKDAIASLSSQITQTISAKKEFLRRSGVAPGTNEMGLFTVNSVRDKNDVSCSSSSTEILGRLNILKSMPENVKDVLIPQIRINTQTYDEAEEILHTIFPKTEWDSEFVEYYRSHTNFILKGLDSIHDDGRCPFCREPFSESALDMIGKYRAYSQDKEAQTIKRIKDLIDKIKNDISAIESFAQSTGNSESSILKLKKYFPSLSDTDIEVPSFDDSFFSTFYALTEALERKTTHLSGEIRLPSGTVDACKHILSRFEEIARGNSLIISRVNRTKNDINKERLALRRNLCKSAFLELQTELRPRFNESDEKKQELQRLQGEIRTKEEQERTSKKEKVYETLTSLLNQFFFGKYTVDRETFHLSLNGVSIDDKAANVLSDGEKSIVAFCLFLANVHRYVEHEDDYGKLFFIIDDPISSMDFQYVYTLAQLLRRLWNLLEIEGNERIWVLTHNLEFFSIISRNHVIGDRSSFEMRPGCISRVNSNLLLPYENHLRDIVKIARNEQAPTHTTPNSIRHVIETVCRFEYPSKNLSNYIEENDALSSNTVIYSLCQDMSHGYIREQPPYSEEILREACLTLYRFMASNYSGQIADIR